ncbi:glycosyltransferase family protein [Jiella pelagia]|uniref:Glycosyltransferase n=1 Tax=Jiella pelagia TaxID=2986949 RepID=A0ABY7BV12_9HYPH|nr:hypothetical protein [Jiella pelagia]WAP66741.1 hypothetical protein OH818_00850 [Jiella pelagia]
MMRCPCCGARDFRRSERCPAEAAPGFRECGHCGILVDPHALASGEIETFLRTRLVAGTFVSRRRDPIIVESYALRTLALSRRLALSPLGAAQRHALCHPYQPLPANAALSPLAMIDPVPVTLVILCRPVDLKCLTPQLPELERRFDDIVLMLDATMTPQTPPRGDRVRLVARPLAGNFAAQRNAGQVAAKCDWVLQLDADESLGAGTHADLGRVAALADSAGAVSVGLPRRNLVDCVLADLYPDVQYRLNHRTVQFEGTVHERPAPPRGWRDSFIAPNLAIDHHLTAAHVEARSARYEQLSPGKGRMFERDALLTPYRP